MKPSHRNLFAAASALAFTATNLHAQIAWDGGGGGGNTDYSNALNWAGDIIPGDSNNNGALIGNATTVIYNTATSYTSIGTEKANSLLVGTGGGAAGSLTLSGDAGTLTFGGDGFANAAWIGTNAITQSNTTGIVTVSAGKLAITGGDDASINLGVRAGSFMSTGVRDGTLIVNGGTVEVGLRILMGANLTTSRGLLTISSGTLDMKRTGSNSDGDLGMIRLGNGTNTVNLDGGTAILTGFRVSEATNARSTIFFNGTTLRANATNADFLTNSGTTANVNLRLKTGGLIVDTNNFAVSITDNLTQETGHTAILRKEGLGTLTLSGASNHTGATNIEGGTLALGATGSIDNTSGVALGGGTFDVSAKSGGYTVNNLTGVGTVVGGVNVSTSLAIGNSPGTMNFGSLTLGAASTFSYEMDGGTNLADLGNVSQTLNLGGATLSLLQLGTYTLNDKFTLFGYETGNLIGTFAGLAEGDFTTDDLGGTWRINYADSTPGFNSGTGTSFVTITAIPEPATALFGGLGLLALFRRRRFIERIA